MEQKSLLPDKFDGNTRRKVFRFCTSTAIHLFIRCRNGILHVLRKQCTELEHSYILLSIETAQFAVLCVV